MKKAISVLLCIVLVVSGVFAMAGCTKQKQITNDIVLNTVPCALIIAKQ